MDYQKLSAIAMKASILAGIEILKVYETGFDIEYKADNSPLTTADKIANDIIVKALEQTPYPILSEESKEIDFNIRKHWSRYWLVDPLDGTKEFISKNGEFTVNIALIENRKPVLGIIYAPVSGDLYYGISGEGAYKWNIFNLENFDAKFMEKIKIPCVDKQQGFRVVASRSHMNSETVEYIDNIKKNKPNLELVTKGSSLKLCLIAEGNADIYPRFGPTMEWDIATGHAIVEASGGRLMNADGSEFLYNKENLLNPYFIAERA